MKKDFSLTFIQVVCAIAVVTLHANNCFWNFSATERYWFTANIIESVFYFAIPLFFMVSGITLLNYQDRYSTRVYFQKRAKKTLLPYIAWSMIGIIFQVAIGKIAIEMITFKWVIDGLLSTNQIIRYYWFFQPLFCVYLCIPLFAAVEKEKKKKIADYVITGGLLINILIPFINNVLHLDLPWPYSISAVADYLFWVWAGYRVYYYPPTKRVKMAIYVFAIIGLLTHMVGTYELSIKEGSIQSLYKGYNNLPCVLYSLGMFLLLRDIAQWIQKYKGAQRIICFLGEYTFPLYLMHWVIMQIKEMIHPQETIVYRLLGPYAIFAIVIGITWVLRKIPGVRKIVP